MKVKEAVRNKVARISRLVSGTQLALFQAKIGLLLDSLENLTTAISSSKKRMVVSQKLLFVSIAEEYTEGFDSPPWEISFVLPSAPALSLWLVSGKRIFLPGLHKYRYHSYIRVIVSNVCL